MFISDTLSRLLIEVQEDVHDVIDLNFLKYLNTAHISHNYKHPVYTYYKHIVEKKEQMITKP